MTLSSTQLSTPRSRSPFFCGSGNRRRPLPIETQSEHRENSNEARSRQPHHAAAPTAHRANIHVKATCQGTRAFSGRGERGLQLSGRNLKIVRDVRHAILMPCVSNSAPQRDIKAIRLDVTPK